MKSWLERKTGILFGTYRWTPDKPAPRVAIVLRSKADPLMVRVEASIGRRGFYATPKSANEAASGERPQRCRLGDLVSVTVTGVLVDYDADVGEFHVRGTVPGMDHIEWTWPFHWATEFTPVRQRTRADQ